MPKAFRDLNLAPVPKSAAPWRTSRPGALLSPRETRLLESFVLPRGSATAGQVVCSSCAETGATVEDVEHQGWCIYVDGPVCPDRPN